MFIVFPPVDGINLAQGTKDEHASCSRTLSYVIPPPAVQLSLHLLCPGKMSDMKSTWSPGPISHSQASLSHELWKVPQGPRSNTTAPSRPPPGLTNTKPSSSWGGNSLGLAQGWSSSYTSGSLHGKYKLFPSLPPYCHHESSNVILSFWAKSYSNVKGVTALNSFL